MSMQTMIDESGDEYVAIHLSVMAFAPFTGEGIETIACMPATKELYSVPARGFPYARTGESTAVTCPLCKQTVEYQTAMSNRARAMAIPARDSVIIRSA